jgi:acyl-CoA dehydrogenase
MAELIFALLSLAALFALAMNRAPLWAWAAAIAVFTLSLQMGLGSGHLHAPVFNVWAVLGWLAAGGLFALTSPRLKHDYVVMPAYRALKGAMPTISETERQALEAGTVGWDAELFSGTPDWSRLRRVSPITLTAEERAFLDGPTDELCRKLNDWRIRHELHDVPRTSGASSAIRASSACSSPRSMAAWPLGAGAIARARQDLIAQPRRRHHRHGAELARPAS